MARPSQLYLLAYNSLQSLGWSLALFRLLACLAPPVSVHPAYALAGDLICFLQTCAVLETVHAAVGLVPTSPFLAFLQWGGRTHFVLALLQQVPEVQGSPSVFITFMAWSISEVIRYSHYALTTLKVCPAWLTYLRYTAFIPLYPIGVGPGERAGALLRLLCKVLHELPFLSRGWSAVLSASVAEAVPACVQAAEVQAGKGGQDEETGLRKISSAQLKFRTRADCLGILQLS
ncbi:uncharacterized protein [Lolium perenne]|uniref:uncharacterized protein isoform X1 n=1 Tax=Lolium perenne TaxID=4522 RepID=UPI0021F5CDBC|nr:uncharacterized protein LOC127321744 isoform X1 [Lolium perenne]